MDSLTLSPTCLCRALGARVTLSILLLSGL
jgi:hypothetical protein